MKHTDLDNSNINAEKLIRKNFLSDNFNEYVFFKLKLLRLHYFSLI